MDCLVSGAKTEESAIEKTFFQLLLKNVPAALEDDVSFICVEHGAQGVSQNLPFLQPDLVYDPTIIEKPFLELSAFFDQRPADELLHELRELIPNLEYEVVQKEHEDWMEGWKKHFKAFQLVGDFWIVPSWLEAPAEAKQQLRIDPGMAFGTGTHATTQIASKMIYDLRDQVKGFGRALDVGTGTGVLAMIMERLGCAVVEATEIDPMARETAQENVSLHNKTRVNVLENQITDLSEPYDLVVANIIDGVLVRIKEDLIRLTHVGGLLLVTGILEERREDFLVRFQSGMDLELLKSDQKDEWMGYLFRRKK